MKWAVIGHEILRERYEVLNELLKRRGVVSDLEFIDVSPLEFDEAFVGAKEKFDQLRIEAPFCASVLSQFKSLGLTVSNLGAADAIVRREGKWWPESALFYSFNRLFSRMGERLDLTSDVLIVGAGAAAKVAVAAAVRAGFSRINITNKFDDQAIALLDDLKRRYFGCRFEFISQNRLVLLPGTNSLLINTTPAFESNDLLGELHYLNFLRPDGMIWDLVIAPATTPLIHEGEHIGIACVRGLEIAALCDTQWLEWVAPSQSIAENDLLAAYRERFATAAQKPE